MAWTLTLLASLLMPAAPDFDKDVLSILRAR
jgi:hypothetical protein